MRVRHVRVEDAPAVAGLLEELGYPSTPATVAQRLLHMEPTESDEAWVLVDDRPEGTEGVTALAAGHMFWPYELDRPVAEITALVVTPEQRRSGAGTALIAAVEAWAQEKNCLRITVASALQRKHAHAFYSKLGYDQLAKKLEKNL